MADILIPFDFSKNAIHALDQAILISAFNGKKVEVLHITNEIVWKQYPRSWKYDGNSLKPLKEKLTSMVEERKKRLKQGTSATTSIVVKEAATISGGLISRMLQGKSKLMIMGTHGSTGVYDRIFGSNTAVMVNHSLFPVLVIPQNWKPARIENCKVLINLKQLSSVSTKVKSWARFFDCSPEAIHFTLSRQAEGIYADKRQIKGIPCRLIINPAETTLAEDVISYSKSLRKSMMMIFTKEKTFLEKLLVPSLSYKLSGRISIPLLALPFEGIKRK